ncbi:MAG: hypothetical protein ACU0A2_05210 [Cognatishimia sp.]
MKIQFFIANEVWIDLDDTVLADRVKNRNLLPQYLHSGDRFVGL